MKQQSTGKKLLLYFLIHDSILVSQEMHEHKLTFHQFITCANTNVYHKHHTNNLYASSTEPPSTYPKLHMSTHLCEYIYIYEVHYL